MPDLSDLVPFIQDKLEISSYLSWDKHKCIKKVNTFLYFHILINYYQLICCIENSVEPDQLASSEDFISRFILFLKEFI